MKKRIFYSITGVTLFSVCILTFFISTLMYERLFSQAKINIKENAARIKQALATDKNFDMENLMLESRVTVLQSDGRVVYDNLKDMAEMDNHANRPEIVALKSKPFGENTRLSDTLGTQTYYYAVKLDNGHILRLSITIDSIYSLLFKAWPYMFIMAALVTIISVFISKYLTRRIVAPLRRINEESYDELSLFYKKIKKQQAYIETQKITMAQKAQEFNTITENVADGLIVLNTRSEILSINKKAIKILGKENTDYIFKNIIELNRSEEIRNAVNQVYLSSENNDILFAIADKQYLLHISPICTQNTVAGMVILVVDNTKKSEAEKIRREFSANVSHELKTPLTSISGYAELIKSGLAKEEDVQNFAGKIYDEVQNLITLIQAIIKISKLDEQSIVRHQEPNLEPVGLKELVENIVSRLKIMAELKNITFDMQLEKIEMMGVPSLIDETFFNILENAIKYNVPEGTISVELTYGDNQIIARIKDTGIGIPPESIPRIFERFYRVDTSHSKEIPGTGLGLSIVKHAVDLHRGKIHIESDVSQGTVITITFPLPTKP